MTAQVLYYDDPMSWAMLGLLFVVMTGVWMFLILSNLPRKLRVKRVVKLEFGDDLNGKIHQLESLGFENLSMGWLTRTPLPVLIIPFLHRADGIYGVLFRAKRHNHKALPVFLTPLNRGSGALLTSYLPQVSLLVPPENFVQIIGHTDLGGLHNAHQVGLQYLQRNGFQPDPISDSEADEFLGQLQLVIRSRRQAFLRAPLRNTVRMLWRLFTARTPHRGELEAQSAANAEIAAFRNPLVRGAGPQSVSLVERES